VGYEVLRLRSFGPSLRMTGLACCVKGDCLYFGVLGIILVFLGVFWYYLHFIFSLWQGLCRHACGRTLGNLCRNDRDFGISNVNCIMYNIENGMYKIVFAIILVRQFI